MAAKRTKKRIACVSGQKDRRVRKTTAQLEGALHALISEKPYEQIAVKEILDRADVGRSTFYEHFDGKNELLKNSIDEMLAASRIAPLPPETAWYEPMLRFAVPILEYHERHRSARRAIAVADMHALHDQLHAAIVDAIWQAAPPAFFERLSGTGKLPASLLIQTIASTFMLTFRWWLAQSPPYSATEADRMFRALIVPVLHRL